MAGLTNWMTSIQHRFDNWARQPRNLVAFVTPLPHALPWPRWQWMWKFPWQDARERKQKVQEEHNRRQEQIQKLCGALKTEDVTDLQDVLSAMVLSECVYKRPDSEVIRAVNKFKAEFGEQLIPLERVQPSLEHVPHRYLLAETADTLFASFIGTKQYKDFIADANILQGALFHEDYDSDNLQGEEDIEGTPNPQGAQTSDKSHIALKVGSQSSKSKGKRSGPKPAAHRGFLARAKGIPAVELYRLAKKKDRKLVLCGHSLGGAVAVLATLAIFRVLASASSSVSKNSKQVEVKCITFSQPPVGNAALRDYVHKKGWHQHFRTYCIPEDLIPRILSPAYFQHYRSQSSISQPQGSMISGSKADQLGETVSSRLKETSNEGERLVLGLGPLQNSLWRISKLVPLVGGPKPSKSKSLDAKDEISNSSSSFSLKDELLPESLAIQEGAEAVALTSLTQITDDKRSVSEPGKAPSTEPRSNTVDWRSRVPSLPSYVPFGQLLLLQKSSVEPLSASEYTQLTSMQSVLLELRERFQSHTMRSYRARFQRVFDMCMFDGAPPIFSMEHIPHLPHLQQWIGFPGAVVTEMGKIAEPLIVRTATSVVPVGWNGLSGEKKKSPLRVDLHGYGLHLCTLVKAQINGQWCSATVESAPSPSYSLDKDLQDVHQELQKMRIRIGAPIQQTTSQPYIAALATAAENMSGTEREASNLNGEDIGAILGAGSSQIEGLNEVTIQCSSDFMSVSKRVVMRLRRVRLLGLEGAGKTSLYYALLGQGRGTTFSTNDGVLPDIDVKEGITEGVAYIDPAGVNLQDLAGEVNQLTQELTVSNGQLGKKVDLVILVHNLAHKIPRLHQSSKPALSVVMDAVTTAGIPYVMAITNKFAVSADRRKTAAAAVMETYRVPSHQSVIVNSCPYAVHGIGDSSTDGLEKVIDERGRRSTALISMVQGARQRLISAPIHLVQLPFRRKEVVLPVEGVKTLCALVHRVLLDNEEVALLELSREYLLLEMQNELAQATNQAREHEHALSTTAAASAIGAGLGLVVAVVVAATSSLRKP